MPTTTSRHKPACPPASTKITGTVARAPELRVASTPPPPGVEMPPAWLRIWIDQGTASLLVVAEQRIDTTRAAHHIAARTAQSLKPGARVTAHAECLTVRRIAGTEVIALINVSLIERHDTAPRHSPTGD